MIGDYLRAVPPSGGSVDNVDADLAIATLQTAELVGSPQERRLPGRGWKGDIQAEAELNTAVTARRAAWKQQKADTQNSQLTAIQRASTHVQDGLRRCIRKVFQRHVQGLEEDLRQRDQRGLFQRLQSLSIVDTWKVSSQHILDEGGRVVRDSRLILGR